MYVETHEIKKICRKGKKKLGRRYFGVLQAYTDSTLSVFYCLIWDQFIGVNRCMNFKVQSVGLLVTDPVFLVILADVLKYTISSSALQALSWNSLRPWSDIQHTATKICLCRPHYQHSFLPTGQHSRGYGYAMNLAFFPSARGNNGYFSAETIPRVLWTTQPSTQLRWP